MSIIPVLMCYPCAMSGGTQDETIPLEFGKFKNLVVKDE